MNDTSIYLSYVVCLYMNARNICYFGIWILFVITCISLLQTDVYKWLKLYEYSLYQFVEIKTVVVYAKNIMHSMSY